MDDLCYSCDGTGERDFLSGAKCYECNGTGWVDREPAEMTAAEQEEYEREMDAFCEPTKQQEPAR